jgi:hypothetical protein
MTWEAVPEPATHMANSGFSVIPPLPSRRGDRAPRTPSAAARRDRFTRRHPEVLITTRRAGTRLVFDVSEPDKAATAYDDADAMMNDLEAGYP